MAGYSGTPLAKKLGIKASTRVGILDAPVDFDDLLGELPAGVETAGSARGPLDLVICFVTERDQLLAQLDGLGEAIHPDGAIWFAWPKKTAGIDTDLTRDVIREDVLRTDLVDVKICAISDIWSGLKVCWRTEAR